MSQPTEQTQFETVDETDDDEPVVEFVPLLNFEDDYEILNQYPFTIRKKSNHRVVSEYIESNGYFRLSLNRNKYLKHVLIAKQFLENPDNLPEVDHINRDRSDYHLSNLRYVSHSTNQRNRTSYKNIESEYVDSISGDAIVVDEYNGHELADYYFHDDVFYFYNGIQYRKLHINTDKRNGNLFVQMKAIDGKRIKVLYSIFKQHHDLL